MTKTVADLGSLCRAHTEACIKKLAGFAHAEEGVPPSVQVAAIEALLDRGWGKPKQTIATAPEDGPLIVEIIQRVREPREPKP